MANYKKKNGRRKRSKFHGFRTISHRTSRLGSYTPEGLAFSKFFKASKAVDED